MVVVPGVLLVVTSIVILRPRTVTVVPGILLVAVVRTTVRLVVAGHGLGVVAHQVESVDIDEDGAVVGGAGGLEDSHHGEALRVGVPIGIPVCRMDLVADGVIQFPSRDGAEHGLEVTMLGIVSGEGASLRELESAFASGPELQFFEEVRGGPDRAEGADVIAQAQRDREIDIGSELAVPIQVDLAGIACCCCRCWAFRNSW